MLRSDLFGLYSLFLVLHEDSYFFLRHGDMMTCGMFVNSITCNFVKVHDVDYLVLLIFRSHLVSLLVVKITWL